MSYLIKIYGSLAFIMIALTSFSQGQIAVSLKDVKSDKGQIIMMLFVSADGFPREQEKAFKVIKVPPTKGEVNYTFDEVPFGTYAMCIAHDKNGNDEIDRNFIGMPTERISASNQTNFGKPNFNRSKITLSADQPKIDLPMVFLN